MKKLICTFVLLAAAGTASAEVLEAIVIRVGDRIVTRSQYQARLDETLREIAANAPADEATRLRADAPVNLVQEMIGELLLKDRIDRLNLTVTDTELKDALERLKAQYGIKTDEQFNQSLQSSGLTRAEMEARLRETLASQKLFARELRSRRDLSDPELRERYNREKESYRLPERAQLREIVVLKPASGSLDEARTRATELAEAARKPGTDFAKLASTMSESGSRDKGGDLGEAAKGDLVADLDKAVFNAAPGSIIGPIETTSAFFIMKVEQRLPSEVPAFDSIKDKLRRDVNDETFQRDYRAYVDALRKEAFVEIRQENLPKG